ncbi:hypothetical protein A3K24_00455 [candidate division Kazan bacterium RIFCSPHIGHO2_01_FULL_44_14]|uniref:SSD domain-containing protein n=1 Tax=candidate division Kazan bacterium RIFCSPLOWO2_01_FULL_45_19 TaxID=1798538 RepID=A0A1F4NPW7_UNCK3|nr:MAG: hypothetical protein A3K51_00455 [candidate division Kazan bacterium RIFCSPLOWO2_01_FULL_45_19]OGB77583.1 MAG: hypothetical protein A3K24_00455 [candidate division Kazan bacterium RIFCSPHIGHO2_01_FULL_44_14]
MERPNNKLVNWIMSNPAILVLLFIAVIIGGIISGATLKREGFPSININLALISAPYPGASATQVEDQLLRPLEEAIAKVKSVTDYQTTASDSFGFAQVTLDDKVNVDDAIRDLTAKIDQTKFPDGVDKPQVNSIDASPYDFIIAIAGAKDDWDLYRKTKLVQDEIRLSPSVQNVEFANGLTPEIKIDFDQDKLNQAHLTRTQVEDAIKSAHLDIPIGSFYNSDQEHINLGITRSIDNLTQLQDLRLTPTIRLKDVANVFISLNNNNQYNRIGYRNNESDEELNISRALLLTIKSKPDVDLLNVDQELQDLYATFDAKPAFRDDFKLMQIYSQADATSNQLEEISKSVFGSSFPDWGVLGFVGYLFGGIWLVILLLLLFVNFRVAILAAISIPVSVGATLAWLMLAGIPLNIMVLFSMILAIGLIVDPTIVFLEAMQRYREQGYIGKDAAAKAVSTVGLGMSLAVFTNFVVFVPFGIVSGFFGQIIRFIPLTVIPAMIASLVVPVIFFVPFASKFLKPKQKINRETEPELIGVWDFSKWLGRVTMALLGPGTAKATLRVMIVLTAVALPIVVAGGLVQNDKIRFVQFANQPDGEYLQISATVNSQWSFDKAVQRVAVPIQDILVKQAEIENFSYIQQNGNSFTIWLQLFSAEYRKDHNLRTTEQLADDLNAYLKAMGWADIQATPIKEGPPTDSYPVKITLFDSDIDKLQTATEDVEGFLGSQSGVTKTQHSLTSTSTDGSVSLVLDKENLASNPFAIMMVAKSRLDTTDLGDLELNNTTYIIKSQMVPAVTSIEQITDLAVGATGRQVLRIKDVINGTVSKPPQTINRLNGRRYVEISARVDKDTDPLAVQKKLDDYLTDSKLNQLGLKNNATETTGSATFSIAKSFTELLVALAIALLITYLVLVGLFGSIWLPLIILFSIPLGLIGAFPAIATSTGQFGFLELLGIVAMAGIVVNVTILLVDFANQMKRAGQTPAQAIATAIAVRFRPILSTQMIAFGSLIPLATYSSFWRGLALVLVFGIITSGLLALITTPILYVWAQGRTRPQKSLEPSRTPTDELTAWLNSAEGQQ